MLKTSKNNELKKLSNTLIKVMNLFGKLDRDEMNAITGIYKSYKREASFYKQRYEDLKAKCKCQKETK